MEFERYFFEIGVYACSSDKFHVERSKQLQAHFEWLMDRSGGITREQAPHTFMRAEEHFLKTYGGWRYTQAIGRIRLYALGTQARGDAWVLDAKRIDRRMRKRRFEYYGKLFELDFFPSEQTSSDIYNQICHTLTQVTREEPFAKRYLDLEAFHNVGPFINWCGLLGLD